MNIAILTPEREIFKGAIKSVKVPGTMGQFQVLQNHAPIVSSLEAGKVELVTSKGAYEYFDAETNPPEAGRQQNADQEGRVITFNITGGFIEVLNNEVSLLVQGVARI